MASSAWKQKRPRTNRTDAILFACAMHRMHVGNDVATGAAMSSGTGKQMLNHLPHISLGSSAPVLM